MPFSFVHASDLELGAPLFAVADLPDELRTRILDARYAAARRVIDLAIGEQVDAVLFAGGVISSSAGPRAMRFFVEQCARLEAAGIDVIWSEVTSGRRWPDFVALPGNVALTSPEVGHVYECVRGGRSAAEVLTADSPPSRPANRDLLRIGILPAAADRTVPDTPAVDYWALGGRSLPGAAPAPRGRAQFSGTTQGASPVEQGPRGCMLVHADDRRRLTSRFLSTAGFEWREECIEIDQDADWENVRGQLSARFRTISRAAAREVVLVRWVLRGHGIVWRQLLREDVNAQLLHELRSEFSEGSRPVWSLFIEPVSAEMPRGAVERFTARMDPVHAVPDFDRKTAIPEGVVGGVDPAHATNREPHFRPSRDAVRRPEPVH